MTLDSSELIPGAVIEAAHVLQFYNLLTGGMTDQAVLLKNKLTLTRVAAAAPTVQPYLLVTGIADTLYAGEIQDVLLDLNRTVQFALASIPALNRSVYVKRPTLASNSAGTLAEAATLAIQGAPAAGTNLTITNTYALIVEDGLSRFEDGIVIGVAGGVQILSGSGAPEGAVTAPAGSKYLRTNGTDYRKATGSGNTGWVVNSGMTINSIQRGTITMTAGSATATITAVVTAMSILTHLGMSSVGSSFTNMTRLALTNTTTITATKEDATNSITVSYQVVEYV